MIKSKRQLIIALLMPIIALAFLAGFKKYVLIVGREITLPIEGYDPRDLLSGHYLRYQIKYGVTGICAQNHGQQTAFVCLEPKSFSYEEPFDCATMIGGVCEQGRFEAGIERYYVPEHDAKRLEALLRSKPASIVLSVTPRGTAQVKRMEFDDKSAP